MTKRTSGRTIKGPMWLVAARTIAASVSAAWSSTPANFAHEPVSAAARAWKSVSVRKPPAWDVHVNVGAHSAFRMRTSRYEQRLAMTTSPERTSGGGFDLDGLHFGCTRAPVGAGARAPRGARATCDSRT